MEIRVKKSKKDKNPSVFQYEFGETIEEAIAMFDGDSPLEKVVYGLFLHAARAQAADHIRGLMEPADDHKPYTHEQLQDLLSKWKPSVERRAKANVARALKLLSSLSAEEKEALKLIQSGAVGSDDDGEEDTD